MTAQPAPSLPPEARQFDFWVGDWDVFNQADGQLAGRNRIELRHGGAVLVEDYTTPRGYSGSSLNTYDGQRRQWHQSWMDRDGLVLHLWGGWEDGRMVLRGETRGPDGQLQLERITWTPNADGTVRQHWEQSRDAGRTWQTAFDGLYRRRAVSPPS